MLYNVAQNALAGIFQFLADLHTKNDWDPAVGAIFQQIANSLLGK